MAEQLLNRDGILGRTQSLREAFAVAFGGRVRVLELDAQRRDEMDIFVAKLQKERGEESTRSCTSALWVMFSLVDESGKRLFGNDDLDAMLRLPGRDMRRLFRAASDVNGLGEADDEGDSGN